MSRSYTNTMFEFLKLNQLTNVALVGHVDFHNSQHEVGACRSVLGTREHDSLTNHVVSFKRILATTRARERRSFADYFGMKCADIEQYLELYRQRAISRFGSKTA